MDLNRERLKEQTTYNYSDSRVIGGYFKNDPIDENWGQRKRLMGTAYF